MSTYIADSELSKFNRSTSLEPVKVSTGLARVVKEAMRLGELSNGALDVTVGPLVNLWGFGPEYRPETVPSDELLSTTKASIGLDKLTFENGLLAKKIPGLYVDLSTIAKGYGVDLIAEFIETHGINNYLVEIGGEMRLKGFKHTGELWHVAIEKPLSTERAVHQIIVPKDNAVATSGDYRIYFEADGQRFSHIIDPKTGKPINHKLVSVTVIHPSSMTAEGLSTAMMVMGEEKALAFAEKNDLAVYIIVKTEHGFVEQSTVKFMQYLK
jgi:thiamine biosynthesis lipoprotein